MTVGTTLVNARGESFSLAFIVGRTAYFFWNGQKLSAPLTLLEDQVRLGMLRIV